MGAVVCIKNYTVRQRFELLSRAAAGRQGNLPRFSIELNLNTRNPAAECHILDAARLPRGVKVPAVQHRFFTRLDCRYQVLISLDVILFPCLLNITYAFAVSHLASVVGKVVHRGCGCNCSSLPDAFNCDVVGIVAYLGRAQRLRNSKLPTIYKIM